MTYSQLFRTPRPACRDHQPTLVMRELVIRVSPVMVEIRGECQRCRTAEARTAPPRTVSADVSHLGAMPADSLRLRAADRQADDVRPGSARGFRS